MRRAPIAVGIVVWCLIWMLRQSGMKRAEEMAPVLLKSSMPGQNHHLLLAEGIDVPPSSTYSGWFTATPQTVCRTFTRLQQACTRVLLALLPPDNGWVVAAVDASQHNYYVKIRSGDPSKRSAWVIFNSANNKLTRMGNHFLGIELAWHWRGRLVSAPWGTMILARTQQSAISQAGLAIREIKRAPAVVRLVILDALFDDKKVLRLFRVHGLPAMARIRLVLDGKRYYHPAQGPPRLLRDFFEQVARSNTRILLRSVPYNDHGIKRYRRVAYRQATFRVRPGLGERFVFLHVFAAVARVEDNGVVRLGLGDSSLCLGLVSNRRMTAAEAHAALPWRWRVETRFELLVSDRPAPRAKASARYVTEWCTYSLRMTIGHLFWTYIQATRVDARIFQVHIQNLSAKAIGRHLTRGTPTAEAILAALPDLQLLHDLHRLTKRLT